MEKPAETEKLMKDLTNPWKLAAYQFFKLPSLFFWRVRVIEIDNDYAKVTIPFNWWTQNPFRSIYFAALAGAGEFSTGVLVLLAIAGRKDISMLVTNVNVTYVKKAIGKVTLTCEDGNKIHQAVQKAIETGEGQEVVVKSTGQLADGKIVCEVLLTWSFKLKP